jgi:putative membrane protein
MEVSFATEGALDGRCVWVMGVSRVQRVALLALLKGNFPSMCALQKVWYSGGHMRIKAIQVAAWSAALALAGSFSSSSFAQSAGQASSADKSFVKNAIEGGNAEIELGEMAMARGTSDDVKQFGKKMVDDHTQLGEQMKTVAGQIGVTPPKAIPALDKALEMKLKMLSANDFEAAYIKAMVKDHQQDLADFKKEAMNGSSPAVKNAATQGMQVISSNLQMIQQIAQSHNAQAANK